MFWLCFVVMCFVVLFCFKIRFPPSCVLLCCVLTCLVVLCLLYFVVLCCVFCSDVFFFKNVALSSVFDDALRYVLSCCVLIC